MDTQANRQRLLEAGFTEQQATAILDVISSATSQLVTRDYLDQRLLRLSEHFDTVLDSRLRSTKRDLLAWQLAMFLVFVGPLYLFIFTRQGV